jgi:hypothetical protein
MVHTMLEGSREAEVRCFARARSMGKDIHLVVVLLCNVE